jgi:cell division protein FtsB
MVDKGRAAKKRKSPAATRNPAMAALRRRRRILVRVLIAGMILVALLFVFVFPARTLLAQRQKTDEQRKTLELLQQQSRELAQESRRLQSDAEVERMAREQYGFVFPGERPFVVVPPSTTAPPASTTTTKPAKKP